MSIWSRLFGSKPSSTHESPSPAVRDAPIQASNTPATPPDPSNSEKPAVSQSAPSPRAPMSEDTDRLFPIFVLIRHEMIAQLMPAAQFIDSKFDEIAPKAMLSRSDLAAPWDSNRSVLAFAPKNVDPGIGANLMMRMAGDHFGEIVNKSPKRMFFEFNSDLKLFTLAPPPRTVQSSENAVESDGYIPKLFPRQATFKWWPDRYFGKGKELAERIEPFLAKYRYTLDSYWLRNDYYRFIVTVESGRELDSLLADFQGVFGESHSIPGDTLEWTRCEHGRWYDQEWYLPNKTSCVKCAAK